MSEGLRHRQLNQIGQNQLTSDRIRPRIAHKKLNTDFSFNANKDRFQPKTYTQKG